MAKSRVEAEMRHLRISWILSPLTIKQVAVMASIGASVARRARWCAAVSAVLTRTMEIPHRHDSSPERNRYRAAM